MPEKDEHSVITRLVLVPAGATVWQEERRMVGNANLPLSEDGIAQSNRWAEQLGEDGLDVLCCSEDSPAVETAKIIAKKLKLRVRSDAGLAEINLGLWQGMQIVEIQKRHPKVYKQWLEQPESVTPPQGESIAQAQKRVSSAIKAIVKKNVGKRVAVVLGQITLALVRIEKEGLPTKELWQIADEPVTWHEYMIKNEVE